MLMTEHDEEEPEVERMNAPTLEMKHTVTLKPGMRLRKNAGTSEERFATVIYIVNADHHVERRWGVMWEDGRVTVVQPDWDFWWRDFELVGREED